MKHDIKTQLAESPLKTLYPLPEGYETRIRTTLDHMAAAPQKSVKRRPAAAVLVFAALMIVSTGVLALHQYGVLDFLFPAIHETQRAPVQALTHPVQIEKKMDGMKLTIDSLFYDGESFALDWTLKNEQPDQPRFVELSRFTVNGQKLWSDGTDGFDGQWLPGYFSENGMMQDGEYNLMPYQALGENANKLDIHFDIDIFTPNKPLYYLPESCTDGETVEEQEKNWANQRSLIQDKLDAGYIVMHTTDFVIPDPDASGQFICVIGPLVNILPESDYTRHTMKTSFTVDVSAFRNAYKAFESLPCYTHAHFTMTYTKAVLTPAALYLNADILYKPDTPENQLMNGFFNLSDEHGNKIDLRPLEGEVSRYADKKSFYATFAYPLAEYKGKLPDTVSLTFYPEDGSAPLLSPIKLP